MVQEEDASSGCEFTVLLPIVRQPFLLPYAVQSVINQVQGSFELMIICDGAPEETLSVARKLEMTDSRIHVFPFPKGERYGEAHRHEVLQQAKGRYVCQIADDDLWFPEHLTEMGRLLGDVEFGNVLHTFISDTDEPGVHLADLADPRVQHRMKTTRWNFFGPTVSGYRMETYNRLPVGWSPAPTELWSDLFMWRKFLSLEGLHAGTRFVSTSVHFPASIRTEWSLERRVQETTRYAELIRDAGWRRELQQRGLRLPARTLSREWERPEASTNA